MKCSKKAYIGIKYHEDYSNKIIIDKISSVLEKKGYETICIVRDINMEKTNKYDPYQLMKLTFEKIDICDLVIIDLTEKGVGLGIEAGYAYAKEIPVITIAKSNSDISETLKGISKEIFFYNNVDDLEILFNKKYRKGKRPAEGIRDNIISEYTTEPKDE